MLHSHFCSPKPLHLLFLPWVLDSLFSMKTNISLRVVGWSHSGSRLWLRKERCQIAREADSEARSELIPVSTVGKCLVLCSMLVNKTVSQCLLFEGREHRCWSQIDYNQTHITCAVFLSEFQTSQIQCLWVNLFTLSLKPGTKSLCCLLVLKIQVKRMFLFDSWLNYSGDRHLPNLQWHPWALPPAPSLSPCSVLPSSLINQAYI